jgi:hypothetical protein
MIDLRHPLAVLAMVLDDGSLWHFPPDTTPPPGDAKGALTQSCAGRMETDFESLGRWVSVEHTGCAGLRLLGRW